MSDFIFTHPNYVQANNLSKFTIEWINLEDTKYGSKGLGIEALRVGLSAHYMTVVEMALHSINLLDWVALSN
ncbi:unnamed protein product [Heterobilharzia americana]|nr:unnamed protein product [Heterobilharzia americana]